MNDIHVGILHDLDAEVYLLSACLINPLVIPKISNLIEPEDFYREAHRNIFQVFLDLHKKEVEITPQILSDSLTNGGQLEVSGGINYIFSIADSNSTTTAWADIAAIVKGYSDRRKLVDAGRLLMEHAANKTIDLDVAASEMKKVILEIDKSRKVNYETNFETCENIRQRIDRMQKEGNHYVGVLTGLPNIDRRMMGLEKGLTYYLSAKGHTGKSALAIQWADNIIKQTGKRVLYYTLESTKQALVTRRICARSQVKLNSIRRGLLSNDHQARVQGALAHCSEEDFIIFDSPDYCKLDRLESHAEVFVKEHDTAIVIIDYMQLLRLVGNWSNKHGMFGEIATHLNQLGKRLNVPLLILSQVNNDNRLKESGDIYDSADCVILLENMTEFGTEGINKIKFDVTKGKDSGLFTTYLNLDANMMTFYDGEVIESFN